MEFGKGAVKYRVVQCKDHLNMRGCKESEYYGGAIDLVWQLEDTKTPISTLWAKLAEKERGGDRLDNRWVC